MAQITYEDERTKLRANVRPATYRDDLKRLDMQQEATKKDHLNDNELVADVFTYPRLICATPDGELVVEGETFPWPPTLDQILDASVDGVDLWYAEVRRINPTWFSGMEIDTTKKTTETKPQIE